MPPTLLSVHELAEKLDSEYSEILSWTRRGLIPSLKIGGRYVYNLKLVVKAIRAIKVDSQPETQGVGA